MQAKGYVSYEKNICKTFLRLFKLNTAYWRKNITINRKIKLTIIVSYVSIPRKETKEEPEGLEQN